MSAAAPGTSKVAHSDVAAKKKKGPGALATAYLVIYNVVMTAGWVARLLAAAVERMHVNAPLKETGLKSNCTLCCCDILVSWNRLMAKTKIHSIYQQKHSVLQPHAAYSISAQWLVEINVNWLNNQIPGWHTDCRLKVVFYA